MALTAAKNVFTVRDFPIIGTLAYHHCKILFQKGRVGLRHCGINYLPRKEE